MTVLAGDRIQPAGVLVAARVAAEVLRVLPDAEAGDLEAVAKVRLWPGWGVAAKVFEQRYDPDWAPITSRVRASLTDDEWRSASMLVDTSFYTPPWLAAGMWQLLVEAGFPAGGRVLVPGLGGGVFAGAAPDGAQLVGVEADRVTARIAQAAWPAVEVIAQPMQGTVIQRGSFDAAIGNVPFGKTAVHDPARPGHVLHQYMIRRALEAVRPGGLVALITSRHTLDRHDAGDLWRDLADLVGAVRLPTGGVFRGTQACTDLLVWRVRRTGEEPRDVAAGLGRVPCGQHTQISGWWQQHPDLIAGTLTPTDYSQVPLRVVTDDAQAAVADSVARLTELVPPFVAADAPLPNPFDVDLTDPDGRKEGSFHVDGDSIVRIVAGAAVPVRGSAELRTLIGLRDQVQALMAAEADHDTPDSALTPARNQLATLYRDYRDRYGALNRGELRAGKIDTDTDMPTLTWRRPRMGGFRSDPDAPLVWALELYDQVTGAADPAPILQSRVNRRPTPIVHVATGEEAVAVSLAESGHVDLARVAALLSLPDEAAALTAVQQLVLRDPADGCWRRRVDLLWGDIPAKLAAARQAAATDSTYQATVDALTACVPAPLGPTHIWVSFGMPWITPAMLADFCAEVLGARADIQHSPQTGAWDVKGFFSPERCPAAFTTYGSDKMSAFQLLKLALNSKPVVVDMEVPIPGSRWGTMKVKDPDATIVAQDRVKALEARFSTWVWEDADRAEQVCAEYNRRFNSHMPRVPDGSWIDLHRFGLSPTVEPWPWQRDGIDQTIANPANMCILPVGSGKSLIMAASAVVLRRLGLANKPMIIVPNHLLEQAVREALQAFPAAKILAAGSHDLEGVGRRLFAARAATGDWDMIIVTHEVFGSIPVHPDVERQWLQSQVDELEVALHADPRNHFGAKEIARRLRTLTAKLDAARTRVVDPDMVLWEHLGVDHLQVDEVTAFKRLPITTRATGFSLGSSKRAADLHLKVTALRNRRGSQPFTAFYTGTPWTNTLVETFVWQTYLQPGRLQTAGVADANTWIGTFVSMETRVEPSPEGATLRVHTRPYQIRNPHALMRMFAETAFILTADRIPLDRPAATWHTVEVDPTPQQASYVTNLASRADTIRRRQIHPKADNMLKVCGDGRQVALDPVLVNLTGGSPKLAAAADRIATLYLQHRDDTLDGQPGGALQLVFCDLGTPRPGQPQTYGRLKTLLAARGVPADRVRWVHEAQGDKARAALFAACRAGEVSVLLASTEKAGLGTNIQTRLRHVHHLDVPWRATDIEQREGRAIRPGNSYPAVDVWRYITRATFDAFAYAAVTRKARFFEQLYRAVTDPTLLSIDDVGEVELSYAQVTAAASGNPLLTEHADLAATVRRLRVLRSVGLQQVKQALRMAAESTRAAELCTAEREHLQQAAHLISDSVGDLAGHVSAVADRISAVTPTRVMYDTKVRSDWHGLRIVTSLRRSMGGNVVEVRHDLDDPNRYSGTFGTITQPASQWRGTRAKVTARLAAALAEWVTALPGRIDALGTSAERNVRAAAQAQRIADDWQFEHAEELDKAEKRLAMIVHDIESSAA